MDEGESPGRTGLPASAAESSGSIDVVMDDVPESAVELVESSAAHAAGGEREEAAEVRSGAPAEPALLGAVQGDEVEERSDEVLPDGESIPDDEEQPDGREGVHLRADEAVDRDAVGAHDEDDEDEEDEDQDEDGEDDDGESEDIEGEDVEGEDVEGEDVEGEDVEGEDGDGIEERDAAGPDVEEREAAGEDLEYLEEEEDGQAGGEDGGERDAGDEAGNERQASAAVQLQPEPESAATDTGDDDDDEDDEAIEIESVEWIEDRGQGGRGDGGDAGDSGQTGAADSGQAGAADNGKSDSIGPGERPEPAVPPVILSLAHARPPRARTVTSAPPPPPSRARPTPFEVASPQAAAAPGISAQFRAAYEARIPPAGAPAQETAPDPLARPLETPSVLDKLIDEIAQGSFEARADALARELEIASERMSKERVGALAYELGELCERQLGDETRAVKAFGRALQADPTLRPNLWAIRRVFYRRALWPNLVKLISAESRLAVGDPARADLLVEKGRILEDHVGDAAGAVEAYEQALASDSTCVAALSGLERLALRRGDDDWLERVWPLLADATETPRRKQVYYLDLVRLLGERGGGGLARAREFMARAVELGGLGDRGARVREWLAEKSGDPAELLAALDLRATELLSRFGPAGPRSARPGTESNVDDSAGESEAATRLRHQTVALHRRQARIAVHELGDPERAWGYLQQATALLPGEPLLIADLADLAERLGKYDELAELVESWESEEADPARALSLALRRADALFRGGHGEAARSLLATLAASQPPYLPILALRERDALARADVTTLAETYAAAGEAAESGTGFGPGAPSAPDPQAAAAHQLVAGDLYLNLCRAPELARGCYEKALELRPGYPPAVLALGALHERAGRPEEAAALYDGYSAGGEPGFRAHLLERLVELYERMDPVTTGSAGPTDRRPAQAGGGGRAVEIASALRRLVALDPDDVQLRWRLEETLAGAGAQEERAELLADIAERLSDPDQRAATLLECARLHDEELGQTDRAIAFYRQVVDVWPGDRHAREALADALRRAGHWEELAAERRAEARELDDGPAAARALREAAALLSEKLDRPGEAAALYRDLCDRVPDDADALAALADSLARAGDSAGALEALEREVATRDGGPEAGEVLYRLARGAEKAGRLAEAEDAYRRAQAVRPESARAATALLDLAAQRRDAPAEVDALLELAESPVLAASGAPSAPAVVAAELTERAAWLCAASVGDGERGLQLFERALELDSGRRGALLGRLLLEARVGDPFALGEALSDLASALPPSDAAAALYLRAAALAEVQGDEDGVEERMARALAAAPDDVGTLVVASEYVPPLAPLPAAAPGGTEAMDRRAELFAARAELAGDLPSRHDWQLDRADLLEAGGRLGEALTAVRGVLEERPEDIRALKLLRRICRRGGERNGLARASAALSRVLGDREGRLELLREAAEIFDGELRREDQAVPIYRRILAEDPGAEEFHRLHQILVSHDDVGGLFEILSQRVHHLDAMQWRGAALVHFLVERAKLRFRLQDDPGAVRDLTAALEVDPDHVEALFLRGGALARLGDSRGAASSFEAFLERAGEDPRRGEAELTLAEILAEDMHDLSGAIVQLEHVVREAPHDPSVRERLIDLLLRAGENRRAADELRNLERLRTSPAEKARDEMRLARLLREKLGERSGALAALERARELDPLASEPVRQLVEIYPEGDERRRRVLEQSARVLRAAIAADPARASLYERLAAIGHWLGDAETRAVALAAQAALGSLPPEQRRLVAEWSARRPPVLDPARFAHPLGATDWALLIDPDAGGFMAGLWSLIGPAVAMSLPREPRQLGFAKGDRRRPRDLEQEAPAVLAFLHLFGCDDPDMPDVYITDGKPAYARAVGGERRALFLGLDVAAARSAEARFALARVCSLLHQRTASLAELADQELAAWFAASAQLALGRQPDALVARADAFDPGRMDELVKHLEKHLDRRERKSLTLAERGFEELGDPGQWRRSALRTGARAGLLLCDDLPTALDLLDLGPGARSFADDRAALSLLAWAVSGERRDLRRRLGIYSN